MTRITYAVCIRGWESIYMVFNRNCFPKMTDFSRLGALQAVTHGDTLKVVVSKKWREIDTLTLKVIRLMQDLSNAIRPPTNICATLARF